MAVKVQLPAALREHAGGAREFSVEAATVLDALQAVGVHHPKIRSLLVDGNGKPHTAIHIYVNDVDIQQAQGMQTKLNTGDVVRILPRVQGT